MPQSIPTHVAIIMDGNGRWAQARGLPRLIGHKQGVEAVKRTIEAARDLGIRYLTLFAFSSENWKRPIEEVNGLMGLLRQYLKSYLAEFHEKNGRLKVIGDRARLPSDIVQLIVEAEKLTANNTTLMVTMALSYGGRQELTEAARRLAEEVKAGHLQPQDISEQIFANALSTSDVPDPDLLIRTSGEQRISNFLLWQLAYAELIFVKTAWPDFGKQDLEQAIKDYGQRERRFGNVIAK